jgi:hypothetical protein
VNTVAGKSCKSSDFTIWWRLTGPVIISGLAEPVEGKCEWEGHLPSVAPGSYEAWLGDVVCGGLHWP